MRFLANGNIPLRSIALIGERGFDIKSVAREMPGGRARSRRGQPQPGR